MGFLQCRIDFDRKLIHNARIGGSIACDLGLGDDFSSLYNIFGLSGI